MLGITVAIFKNADYQGNLCLNKNLEVSEKLSELKNYSQFFQAHIIQVKTWHIPSGHFYCKNLYI